jgi:hypothetical protein
MPADSLLVIASTAVRVPDTEGWHVVLRELAPAGKRLASVLLDHAGKRSTRDEDLLAVVVRQRANG